MDSFALVALEPESEGEIIAMVSFDREGETSKAEYAAAVEDRWQGRVLGLALTRQTLEGCARSIGEAGGIAAGRHLRAGDAASEIVELAEELGVGLVVLGSRGHGRLRRALMGSVSTGVGDPSRGTAPCPPPPTRAHRICA